LSSTCENCTSTEALEGTKFEKLPNNESFGDLGLSPEFASCYGRVNFIERLSNYSIIYFSMLGFRFNNDKFYLTLGGYDVKYAQT